MQAYSAAAHYFNVFGVLISAIFMLTLARFAYLQNKISLNNRAFSWLLMAVGFWTLGTYFRFINTNPDYVLFLYRLTHCLGSIASAFMLYFACIFPKGKDASLRVKLMIFLPCAFFATLAIFTNLMVKDFVPWHQQYVYVGQMISGGIYNYYNVYTASYLLISIGLTVYKWFKTTGRERAQVSFLIVSIIIGGVSGNFFTLWLPHQFKVISLDSLGHIAFILPLSLIAFAINRYKLFVITPTVAAKDLLHSLGGEILVTDLNGKVIYKHHEKYHVPDEEIKKIADEAIAHNYVKSYKIKIDGMVLRITAQFFKEQGGVVMILHDQTEIEKMEEEEELTRQEFEARLTEEKAKRAALIRLTTSFTSEEIERSLKEVQDVMANDRATQLIFEQMLVLLRKRTRLLEELKQEKEVLEGKLRDADKNYQESIQRELKMVELKEKISQLKGEGNK